MKRIKLSKSYIKTESKLIKIPQKSIKVHPKSCYKLNRSNLGSNRCTQVKLVRVGSIQARTGSIGRNGLESDPRFHAMNNMPLASICQVRLKLTSSMNACLLPTRLHAMCNMQLVSTFKVGFKLTLSCGCMFVPTCSYLWMHVYSHFDYMQFAFNSFHEQHACLRLASTCKVGFKLTWSFEGTLSSNLGFIHGWYMTCFI